MKSNIRLKVAYDGTHYKGWQEAKMGPSIQGTLRVVLEQILQHPIKLEGTSRTDAGVHAEGQCAHFLTPKEINLNKLHTSLNRLLPSDIRILEVCLEKETFHSTLDCLRKTYRYYICFGNIQQPHHRFTSWHRPTPLDIELMRKSAQKLIGKYDFAAFSNNSKQEKDTICHLSCIKILELKKERLCIEVTGNRFLFRMVRNLIGTLIYIGEGKLKCEIIDLLLDTKDRRQAGITAPAHGLSLYEVIFREDLET